MSRLDRNRKIFVSGQYGFTLIELLVVVVVLAILAGLAAPSFSELIASQRVRAAASSLYDSLLLARSEAIKRNNVVTLTPASSNLSGGWSVLLADGTTSVRNQEAFDRVAFNPVNPALSYTALGRLAGGAAIPVAVTGPGTSKQWTVRAEASGRVCVVEGGGSC